MNKPYENAVGLEGYGDRWPRGGPKERPMPQDRDLLSYGGGGIYDEEQFMPIPPRLPPSAYRGGQSGMVRDYIMDSGAQNGANGWLNDRLLRRIQPEPMTDMEMMLMYGGDGSPAPVTNNLLRRYNQR